MACCAEGETCPMHKPDGHGSSSSRVLSQAEADSCCAASERDDSAPSASTFSVAVSFGVLASPVPALLPEATGPDSWRRSVPVPASHVPKHLLLSVFLV